MRRNCDAAPAPDGQKTLLVDETRDGGAEVCLVRVPELRDERMLLERSLHQTALDAFAAAMNEADLAQTGSVGRGHVFDDHRNDVTGVKGVQVERGLDRNLVRRLLVHADAQAGLEDSS